MCPFSLEQPSTICPFSYLQKTSQNIPFRLGLSPVDTGVPNGLLMLRNSLNDFVFEHRSGCCATKPGYAGDIGAIQIWLIDWYDVVSIQVEVALIYDWWISVSLVPSTFRDFCPDDQVSVCYSIQDAPPIWAKSPGENIVACTLNFTLIIQCASTICSLHHIWLMLL